jgi:DnaA family protein
VQLLLDLFDPLPQRFENFEPSGNEALVAALLRFAHNETIPGVTTPHLAIWGPPGCGKSHLLHAVAETVRGQGQLVWYAPLREPLDAPPTQSPGAVLLLDDLEAADPATQEQLFHAFNWANRLGQRWLVASQTPPNRLPFREDLRTRLALLPSFSVQPLDDVGRAQLLQRRAAQLGVILSDEAVRFLLTHLPRSIPELLLALEAASEESLRRGKPITVHLLKEVWHLLSQER